MKNVSYTSLKESTKMSFKNYFAKAYSLDKVFSKEKFSKVKKIENRSKKIKKFKKKERIEEVQRTMFLRKCLFKDIKK